MFKMLKEVWLNIEVEKVDMHKGVTVKALLDSSVIGMFMDRKIAARHGFRLQKPEKPVTVRNIDGTNNNGEAIIHQVEVNVYYKNHIERMRINICDLGRTDVILGILWLQAHNPEINWETEEIKITRCPPLCGRNTKLKEDKKIKKGRQVVILEEEKIVRWAVDNKENWRKEKEIKVDYRKIEEIVPRKFLKQKKIFGKVESERIFMKKVQDYAIDLKEMFKSKKGRIYLLLKDEREEVQKFVND